MYPIQRDTYKEKHIEIKAKTVIGKYAACITAVNKELFLKTPKKDSKECSGCVNRGFCDGCLYRAFIKGIELGDGCGWYKNVPKIVKQKLNPINEEV